MDTMKIAYQGIDPSEMLSALIRSRAEKLESLSDRIVSCKVTVNAGRNRKHRSKLFHVSINLRVPRYELPVTRARGRDGEDVFQVVRRAFDAAERRLETHLEKMVERRRCKAKDARHWPMEMVYTMKPEKEEMEVVSA